MHLSCHPNPEPIDKAKAAVESAVGHLASVALDRTRPNFTVIALYLRDREKFEQLVDTLLAFGAREDAQRGRTIMGYKGQMICIHVQEELTDLAVPKKRKS